MGKNLICPGNRVYSQRGRYNFDKTFGKKELKHGLRYGIWHKPNKNEECIKEGDEVQAKCSDGRIIKGIACAFESGILYFRPVKTGDINE